MKRILALLVVLLTLGGQAYAQSKIGHVYPSKILNDLPEYQTMVKKLEEEQRKAEKLLRKLDSTYQAEIIRCNQPDLSEFELLDCESNIPDMEQRIMQERQLAEQKLQNLQQKMQASLTEKVQKAIAQVGEEGGYTYVIDASVMYYVSASSNDLTNMVREKLGLSPLPSE